MLLGSQTLIYLQPVIFVNKNHTITTNTLNLLCNLSKSNIQFSFSWNRKPKYLAKEATDLRTFFSSRKYNTKRRLAGQITVTSKFDWSLLKRIISERIGAKELNFFEYYKKHKPFSRLRCTLAFLELHQHDAIREPAGLAQLSPADRSQFWALCFRQSFTSLLLWRRLLWWLTGAPSLPVQLYFLHSNCAQNRPGQPRPSHPIPLSFGLYSLLPPIGFYSSLPPSRL